MPSIAWGSFIFGAVLGLVLYHFAKGKVGAGA